MGAAGTGELPVIAVGMVVAGIGETVAGGVMESESAEAGDVSGGPSAQRDRFGFGAMWFEVAPAGTAGVVGAVGDVGGEGGGAIGWGGEIFAAGALGGAAVGFVGVVGTCAARAGLEVGGVVAAGLVAAGFVVAVGAATG